ncbi:uncharacterized protein LOC135841043 [Planococcus citri]|uniref:uncharacterized protein LOC135841043 n=1 Tax=Planococcus citri TaxID=170843 RepID=UPI0031F7D81D
MNQELSYEANGSFPFNANISDSFSQNASKCPEEAAMVLIINSWWTVLFYLIIQTACAFFAIIVAQWFVGNQNKQNNCQPVCFPVSIALNRHDFDAADRFDIARMIDYVGELSVYERKARILRMKEIAEGRIPS